MKGITFGLILIAIKIFPRFFDMWIQSTYPKKLLAVEFVNGTIGSFVIGVVFAYVIQLRASGNSAALRALPRFARSLNSG